MIVHVHGSVHVHVSTLYGMFGLFDLHTMFPPGGALLACKLLRSIAELSEVWHENELVNDLNAAAE